MEIGGLGFVNTIASSGVKEGASPSSNSGFAGLFASLMQGTQSSKDTSALSSLSETLSNREIQELVDFLNTTDVLDLDEGLKLLDSIMSGETDVLGLIKDHLGISADQLQGLLQSLKQLVTGNSSSNKETLKTKEVDKQEIPDELESLVAILNLISSMKAEELPTVINKDFSEVAKIAKLFDLLSKHQDTRQSDANLTNLLKQVTEKLEVMLQTQKQQPDKLDYLQKTFTPLVAELNQKIKINSEVSNSIVSVIETNTDSNLKVDSITGVSAQIQQFSKPEQLTLMLGNNSRPVSTEQLIQQFESILSKSQFLKSGGTQKLFIKLNPEHLGSLRIEIIQKDSTMIAKILTSTGAAKDALDSQLNHLKNAFSSQNIQVDRIEVTQQMTQSERFFNRDHQQQEQQRHEQQREKEQKQSNEFTQSFEEALLNTEA